MQKLNTNKSLWLVVALVSVLAIGSVVVAFSGVSPTVMENVVIETYNANLPSIEGESFGASGTRFPSGISADTTSPTSGQVRGTTFTATDAITASGLATLSGGIVTNVGSITATTTLTTASANVQLLATSTTATLITLPAATDGARFEFIVMAGLSGSTVAIDSAEGDNIYGSIMVNDAWVECFEEDQINVITDGELVGDRVEIISDGTNWYIIDSEVDASGKMTCTDPS